MLGDLDGAVKIIGEAVSHVKKIKQEVVPILEKRMKEEMNSSLKIRGIL